MGDEDETCSMTTTTDTDTTLVDPANFGDGLGSWEVEELRQEIDRFREKCDKLEKEKSEILSRRVSSLEAPRIQVSDCKWK